jgi:dihydroflavonol-4-reductase
VDDVVEGIVAAVDRGATGARYILGGDNLTYREWMTKIAAALDVHPRLVPVARAVSDLVAKAAGPLAGIDARFQGPHLRAYMSGRCTFYDSSRAQSELGFRSRPFDAILDECIRATD